VLPKEKNTPWKFIRQTDNYIFTRILNNGEGGESYFQSYPIIIFQCLLFNKKITKIIEKLEKQVHQWKKKVI
jgi:hypothetical protein